ncbi:MAG: NAD(P)-dependent oxidoreductase [Alphaproteobacteria bacterium]|nr:NAD(P)-dependent oxidoreductase [Alphaproteobacteria bacterium]
MTDSNTVGVIGLGIMGGAIAANLAKRGFAVRGYDVAQAATERLEANGGTPVTKPDEAAQGVAALLISLPSVKALEDTVKALVKKPQAGLVVAELSTFPIADKEKARKALAKAGMTLLDCPLSGTGSQAAVGDLVVFASGDGAAFDRIAHVFPGFARAHSYLGAFGNGSKMKFVANLLVAIHNVASAEAMVLGMKAGLDPDDIVRVISSGAGNSRVFELRAPLMAKNRYKPATMKNDVWTKDLKIIGEFAKSLKVDTPLFGKIAALNKEVIKLGFGDSDTAAVCAILEKRAKLKRKRA